MARRRNQALVIVAGGRPGQPAGVLVQAPVRSIGPSRCRQLPSERTGGSSLKGSGLVEAGRPHGFVEQRQVPRESSKQRKPVNVQRLVELHEISLILSGGSR